MRFKQLYSTKRSKVIIGILFGMICSLVLIKVALKTGSSKEEIQIPRRVEIKQGETREFIMLSDWTGWFKVSSMTMDDVVKDMLATENKQEKLTDAYIGTDDSLVIVLTSDQLENQLRSTESALNKGFKKNSDKFKVEISEDFQCVTYYVSSDCSLDDWYFPSSEINANIIKAQLYMGIPSSEWELQEKVIVDNTGETIISIRFPEGGTNMKESEWNEKVSGAKEVEKEATK